VRDLALKLGPSVLTGSYRLIFSLPASSSPPDPVARSGKISCASDFMGSCVSILKKYNKKFIKN
jgi:hypothetical protein